MSGITIPCHWCENPELLDGEHEHTFIQFSNGTTLVFYGIDNKYPCRCGGIYALPTLKNNHALQCQDCMEAAGITLFDISKSLDLEALSSNEFIQVPELDKIMFKIHKTTGMIICTKCRIGVWPDSIIDHCGRSVKHVVGFTETTKHQNRIDAYEAEGYLRSQFTQPCMQKKQIQQWVKTLQGRINPPIPGIDVVKGVYMCKACNFSTTCWWRISKHRKVGHANDGKGSKPLYTLGNAQVLYKYLGDEIFIRTKDQAISVAEPPKKQTKLTEWPSAIDSGTITIYKKPWTTEIGFDVIRKEESFNVIAGLSQWTIPTEMWERALYFISGAALDSLKHNKHTKSIAKGVNKILVEYCYQLVYALIRTSEKYELVEHLMLTPAQYDLAKKLGDYLREDAMDVMYSKSYKIEAVRQLWQLLRELWVMQRNFGDGYAHFFSIFRYFCYASWNVELRCFRDTFSILALAEGLSFWAQAAILVAFEQESATASYPFMSATSVVGNGVVYESKSHHLSIYEGFLEKGGPTPFSAIHKVTQIIGKPVISVPSESSDDTEMGPV